MRVCASTSTCTCMHVDDINKKLLSHGKEKGNKKHKSPETWLFFNDSLFVDTFIDFNLIVQNKPVSEQF